MKRRLAAAIAFAAGLIIAVGCSDGPKSIPPKADNTKLPTEASSDGGKAAGPKTAGNSAKAD